mmetsp:Transcript_456/g.896  ORF Transcript_456/g.896 Transcript_456/m.896 type:complete len:316 (+) Transcript_456:1092-2039(+)
MSVIFPRQLLPHLLERTSQRVAKVRIGRTTIHNNIALIQLTLAHFQLVHIRHVPLSSLSGYPTPLAQIHRLEMHRVKSRRLYILGKHHGTHVQPWIDTPERHGARTRSIPRRLVIPTKTQTKLGTRNGILEMHLFPKSSLFILHPHDTIGKLGNEQSRNGHLTTKRQLECKLTRFHRINMIHNTILLIGHWSIHHQSTIMRSTSITQILRLIRTPRTTLGITHANPTLLLSPHTSTISAKALLAIQRRKCFGLGFLEIIVSVVFVSASFAFFAGEGGYAAAGVDYYGLALGGGGAYPEVNVVGSVALVEGSHLLL